jgi:H+-translocating NAD(P) transhydrogenase subunit alpha
MKVAVIKETSPGERRVALVPDAIPRLSPAGIEVLVESGAGDGAWLSDAAYADAGASIVSAAEIYQTADVILTVTRPPGTALPGLRKGQAVIGMLAPLADPGFAAELAARGVTVISLDGLPRTLSRAQPMDALTSQSNVAGYKAVLVGASEFGRFFPLLITAAGTARPAKVLVLGTGVAGLQAIGTARRLGAVVSGYDIRPTSKEEVTSLGATFIELTSVGSAAGEGGYARELTADERQAQQEELAGHIGRHDVVITTAQVPGRRPPLLVTEDAVKAMAPGSVIVDMGASALGGNVTGSVPGETVVTGNGVTIVGAENLAATVPVAASSAYSRNISALLLHLTRDGTLAIDTSDEIQAGVVIAHDGRVVHEGVASLLQPPALPPHPTAPFPHPTAPIPHPTPPIPHPTAPIPHPTAPIPHPTQGGAGVDGTAD